MKETNILNNAKVKEGFLHLSPDKTLTEYTLEEFERLIHNR